MHRSRRGGAPARRLPLLALMAFAAAAHLAARPAPGTAEKRVVRFAERESAGRGGKASPLLTYLQSVESPYRFVPIRFTTADDVYDGLRKGAIDVAEIGPVLYVRAHHVFGAVPLAADAVKVRSAIFTRSGSNIRSLADLRGRTIAFGYEDSTTSHLIPVLLMSKERISKDELTDDSTKQAANPKLVRYVFVGGHDKVVDAVLSGKADAGAVNEIVLARRVKEGLRAVATSEPFAGVPIVARPGLDPDLLAGVRAILLAFKPPPNLPENETFAKGIVAAADKDYNQTRFLCKVVFGEEFR